MNRYLIDFDGVIARTFEQQILLLNRKFVTTYTVDDFPTWDTVSVLTDEENEWFWGEECFLSPSTTLDATPVELAPYAVERIRNHHEAYVVSDRPHSLRKATESWLYRHIGSVPLILTRSPLSKGDADTRIPTKTEVAACLGIDVAIEDAPHHANDLADIVDRVYLFSTPANQKVQEDEVISRITSWRTVLAREGITS